MTQPATIDEFKTKFDRDFPFGEGKESVRDSDIQNSFDMADMEFNTDLWTGVDEANMAYLYLSAHLLVLNLQAAGGLTGSASGGVNSYGGGLQQAKSVGGVSVTYQIPQTIADDPILAQYWRTGYGQQYLQMARPRLVGGAYPVAGWDDVTDG